MAELSGDISYWVLKGAVNINIGEFSLDSDMLQVLMRLDGKKDLATIARSLNLSHGNLRAVVRKLIELKLVERVAGAGSYLDAEFLEPLRLELSKAMGPIAEVVMEDEMAEFEGGPERIPVQQAAELVSRLAEQIPRNEKRVEFQQAMIGHLKRL